MLTVTGVLEKGVLLAAYFKLCCNSCDQKNKKISVKKFSLERNL